jgi:hypothetical protein
VDNSTVGGKGQQEGIKSMGVASPLTPWMSPLSHFSSNIRSKGARGLCVPGDLSASPVYGCGCEFMSYDCVRGA